MGALCSGEQKKAGKSVKICPRRQHCDLFNKPYSKNLKDDYWIEPPFNDGGCVYFKEWKK